MPRVTVQPLEFQTTGQATSPPDTTGPAREVSSAGKQLTNTAFSVFQDALETEQVNLRQELKFTREDLKIKQTEKQRDTLELRLNNYVGHYQKRVHEAMNEGNGGEVLRLQEEARLGIYRHVADIDTSLLDEGERENLRTRYLDLVENKAGVISSAINAGDFQVGTMLVDPSGNKVVTIGDPTEILLASIAGNQPVKYNQIRTLLSYDPSTSEYRQGQLLMAEATAEQQLYEEANILAPQLDNKLKALNIAGKERELVETEMGRPGGAVGKVVTAQANHLRSLTSGRISYLEAASERTDENLDLLIRDVQTARTTAKENLSPFAEFSGHSQRIAEIDRVAEEQIEYIKSYKALARVTKDADLLAETNRYEEEQTQANIDPVLRVRASNPIDIGKLALDNVMGKMLMSNEDMRNPQAVTTYAKSKAANNPTYDEARFQMTQYGVVTAPGYSRYLSDTTEAKQHVADTIISPLGGIQDRLANFSIKYSTKAQPTEQDTNWNFMYDLSSLKTITADELLVARFQEVGDDDLVALRDELVGIKTNLVKINSFTEPKRKPSGGAFSWASSGEPQTPSSVLRKAEEALDYNFIQAIDEQISLIEIALSQQTSEE